MLGSSVRFNTTKRGTVTEKLWQCLFGKEKACEGYGNIGTVLGAR